MLLIYLFTPWAYYVLTRSIENGAYTVSFTTKFRRAVSPPQIVLIRGRVLRKEGRKIWVKGTIEDKDGEYISGAFSFLFRLC